jgi:hypothetical protein
MKPGALIIAAHYADVLNKRARLEREGGTSPAERTPAGQAGAVEFVSRGEPCLDYLASELAKHAKSADIFQHQRTELSKSPSGASQRSSGPTIPRLGLPHSPSVTCEQPADGFQARSTRPPMSGPSCSPLRLIQTDLCGNNGLGSPNDLRCTAVGPWPAAVLCKQKNGVDKC